MELSIQLPTIQHTQQLAGALATRLSLPMTIALQGTLGAGKTQFVRYLALAMDVPGDEVTSPTYVLLQRYSGAVTVYHFDFYRLESIEQVWDLGIDELFEQNVLIVIEWADRFPACLPDDHLAIRIEVAESGQRTANLTSTGPRSDTILQSLVD